MANCPECESDLELDGYELEIGETIHCPECSTELRILALDPPKLALVEEEEE
jgi:alpha-aminoadipate carrier protein LysW